MKYVIALTVSALLFAASVPTKGANAWHVSQKFRSGIAGRITDPNGSVIVAARITIVARSSHASVSRRSNDEGTYTADLDPDVYDVEAQANGFKTARRKSIPVLREGRSYVDFVLEPAEPATPRLIN